jgi:hypothetical protein
MVLVLVAEVGGLTACGSTTRLPPSLEGTAHAILEGV